jgi:hypothetical protein
VRAVINFLKAAFDRRTMPWFADDYVSPNDPKFRIAASAVSNSRFPLHSAPTDDLP